MEPKQRATMDDITEDMIIDDAKKSAIKAGEEDKIPKRLAVDPAAVAAGDEDEDDIEEEEELDDDGKPKKKEDDEDAYVPEDEDEDDPDEPKKPVETPADPDKDKKPKAADDEEVEAFAQSLRDDGYEESAVKAMLKAVELGGNIALKRVQKAAEEQKASADKQSQEEREAFSKRRRKQYVSVGNLQNEGRLPKVPVAIQKKLVDGKQLSEQELEHPGVKRQNEVWNHMVKQNKEAVANGEEPYLLTFRGALADLESTESRAGAVDKGKADLGKKKRQSALLKGGSGKADTANKGGKPKYVRGQSLDDVVAEINAEFEDA